MEKYNTNKAILFLLNSFIKKENHLKTIKEDYEEAINCSLDILNERTFEYSFHITNDFNFFLKTLFIRDIIIEMKCKFNLSYDIIINEDKNIYKLNIVMLK